VSYLQQSGHRCPQPGIRGTAPTAVDEQLWTGAAPAGAAVTDWRQRARAVPDDGRQEDPMAAERFLQLTDVAEILNISASQTYALVRSGELPAIKIGGRGQWRVERTVLEEYIQRCYDQTRAFVTANPVRDSELVGD
jgi:excisionase family DNA binding protein